MEKLTKDYYICEKSAESEFKYDYAGTTPIRRYKIILNPQESPRENEAYLGLMRL